ncbi:lytic transglycosylase domain-containing protein [Tabrizicola sp. TH137]|uniref:lytic transglycosylase domain-containing protein n=1 Tax=Tabrizicola sp. TH137 TaxID=2067452 RepID=UPI0020B2AD2C|nr:lytic transglycosylase domain-containing protein [Tabrizicola sp. TH137]
MMRRRTLTRDLTLCGGLALWFVAGQGAVAEVIDLGAGAEDLRVRASVLDFGKELPKRVDLNRAQPTDNAETDVGDENLVVLASYGTPPKGRGPRGTAEIEDLVLDVGDDYLRHPALKAAGLSGTEWLALFRANIAVESAFNPDARSSVGAIGLGQLMPGTADLLGVDPYDPEDNLHGSARYLLAQLEDFGAADLALAAYNAGPEAVRDYGGIPPYAETERHVAKVLRLTNATLSSE